MIEIYRRILTEPNPDPGFQGLMGFYMSSPSDRAQHIMRCLQDMDQLRLQHMDQAGIDHQVLALTAPGVQMMDKATAVSFARHANDFLADAVRRHPAQRHQRRLRGFAPGPGPGRGLIKIKAFAGMEAHP